MADVARGDTLVRPDTFAPTPMLDASLEVLTSAPVAVKDLARVHVHLGTSQVLARVRVLGGKKSIAPGEKGYVQLRLESPLVAARCDRFILRRYSPLETIAGGEVLDARPKKHTVHSEASRAKLEALDDADALAAAAIFVEEAGSSGVSEPDLARRLGIPRAELATLGPELIASGRLLTVSESPVVYVGSSVAATLAEAVGREIAEFQRKHPLLEGMPKSELKEKVGARVPLALFEFVLGKRVREGKLRSVRDLVATSDHRIQMSSEETQVRDFLVEHYRVAGYRPKSLAEAASEAKRDQKLLDRVQRVLLKDGTLVQIADGMVFHRDVLDELKQTVRGFKPERDRIDVSFFKEFAGVTRKHAIPLLEWLDRERVTRRAGNERVIL